MIYVLKSEVLVMKKILLIAAMAGILSLTSPANAGVHVGVGFGFGGPYYGPYYGSYYGPYYGYPYYYGCPGPNIYIGPGYYPWYHGYWHGGYYHGSYYGHGSPYSHH